MMPQQTPSTSWARQVEIDLPEEIDEIGSGEIGYKRELVVSMRVQFKPCVEQPSDISSSSQPTQGKSKDPKEKSSRNVKPQGKDSEPNPLVNFNAKWGSLRKECIDPKTTLTVVSTMRNKVLTLMKESMIADEETLDTLDNNWDLLGVNRVCSFVELFLGTKARRLITLDGAYSYVSGMIAAVRVTQNDLFREIMETHSYVSADLNLASKSINAFQESMSHAEEVWRDQSSRCSNYMSKLESQLKLINLQAETPNEPLHKSTPSPQPNEVSSHLQHDNYRYDKFDKLYLLRCIGTPTKKERKIIDQVNFILMAIPQSEVLTKMHPEDIYSKFMAVFKETGDSRESVDRILKEL